MCLDEHLSLISVLSTLLSPLCGLLLPAVSRLVDKLIASVVPFDNPFDRHIYSYALIYTMKRKLQPWVRSAVQAVYRQNYSAEAKTMVNMTFQEGQKGDKIAVRAPVGKTVLDAALDHNIDIEGACGGELACSTCHVILEKALYDKLPPKSEEETDMLDLAWGLTETSRLCCQLKISKDLEGQNFLVPDETNAVLAKRK